jgi:hypothetical protein
VHLISAESAADAVGGGYEEIGFALPAVEKFFRHFPCYFSAFQDFVHILGNERYILIHCPSHWFFPV